MESSHFISSKVVFLDQLDQISSEREGSTNNPISILTSGFFSENIHVEAAKEIIQMSVQENARPSGERFPVGRPRSNDIITKRPLIREVAIEILQLPFQGIESSLIEKISLGRPRSGDTICERPVISSKKLFSISEPEINEIPSSEKPIEIVVSPTNDVKLAK